MANDFTQFDRHIRELHKADYEVCKQCRPAQTEDERVFGKGAWVYCNQHLNAHQTGWCGVSVHDKLGLGIVGDGNGQGRQALDKCRQFGLKLYRDIYASEVTHV